MLVLREYLGARLISQDLKLDNTKIKSGLCLKYLLTIAVVQIVVWIDLNTAENNLVCDTKGEQHGRKSL